MNTAPHWRRWTTAGGKCRLWPVELAQLRERLAVTEKQLGEAEQHRQQLADL
ncbi:hypothetical protein ACLEEZ_10720 [Lonsdalea quercina]|uniref:hypothetical protein n=1 Tax=Lonsdalea quercina TaxID=71657 RepID=UPI0039754F78